MSILFIIILLIDIKFTDYVAIDYVFDIIIIVYKGEVLNE